MGSCLGGSQSVGQTGAGTVGAGSLPGIVPHGAGTAWTSCVAQTALATGFARMARREAGTFGHRPSGQKWRAQAGWVMLLKIIASSCL